MIKRPAEADFVVDPAEAAIEVTFEPTSSHYSYYRLADPDDIAQFGPIGREPRVRHGGPSGDTGEYMSADVEAMAYRLAANAAGGT